MRYIPSDLTGWVRATAADTLAGTETTESDKDDDGYEGIDLTSYWAIEIDYIDFTHFLVESGDVKY